MGEVIISRRGGASLQAVAPTITQVSVTNDVIVFTITNNDSSSAVILWEAGDSTPDANSIELASNATSSNITVSGFSFSPLSVFASANVVGKVKSEITEKQFTFTEPTYINATGGTTEEYNLNNRRYRSHTFTSNGNFTVTALGNGNRNQVDYLIVAGGGAGGVSTTGGGAGGGGFRNTVGFSGGFSQAEPQMVVSTTNYAVTIGGGGASGNDGSGSALSSVFGNTVGGGGGAGTANVSGRGGGCGGGGQSGTSPVGGGAGTIFQGRNGGGGGFFNGGGGGGARFPGGAMSGESVGGPGGAGEVSIIRSGTDVLYSVGGGGGNNGAASPGGVAAGQNGQANTGNGGGRQGNGGSGIVIFRYEIQQTS
jgi:hypothetical protein